MLMGRLLFQTDACGLLALFGWDDVETGALTFSQTQALISAAGFIKTGAVHEDVRAPVVGSEETVPSLVVEKLTVPVTRVMQPPRPGPVRHRAESALAARPAPRTRPAQSRLHIHAHSGLGLRWSCRSSGRANRLPEPFLAIGGAAKSTGHQPGRR
jgi:hypothetical protein